MGALTRAGRLLLVAGVSSGRRELPKRALTLTNRTSSPPGNGEGLDSSQTRKCSQVD
jgi:hypothetical protein